jgi:hypothetical protein
MNEKLELILGILIISAMAIGAFALVLIVQTWFWVAVIAITFINYLV